MSASVEEQLDELQRESEVRRRELREIAAQLPATLSRRALLRAMLADARRAPQKADVVQRGIRKVVRAPRRVVQRLRAGTQRSS